MEEIKPIYKELLLVAIAIFVIGVSLMLSELYYKVISLEHEMCHMQPKPFHKY